MHKNQASWRSKTTRRSGNPEISLLAILDGTVENGYENGSFFVPGPLDFMGINNLIAMNISRLLLLFLFPGIHQIDSLDRQHLSLFFFGDFAKIPSSNLTCLYFLSDISDMASLPSILLGRCLDVFHLAHLAINVVFPEPLEPITP